MCASHEEKVVVIEKKAAAAHMKDAKKFSMEKIRNHTMVHGADF